MECWFIMDGRETYANYLFHNWLNEKPEEKRHPIP
jgi:hypothetical protein